VPQRTGAVRIEGKREYTLIRVYNLRMDLSNFALWYLEELEYQDRLENQDRNPGWPRWELEAARPLGK
jgi:hypothetical protein